METDTLYDNALEDKYAAELISWAIDEGDWDALEIALMDLVLFDLYINREAFDEMIEKANKKVTKQYYRAVAKTVLGMQQQGRQLDRDLVKKYIDAFKQDVAKSQSIWIEEYERRDGTIVPRHQRNLPEGVGEAAKKELQDIAREIHAATEYDLKKVQRDDEKSPDEKQTSQSRIQTMHATMQQAIKEYKKTEQEQVQREQENLKQQARQAATIRQLPESTSAEQASGSSLKDRFVQQRHAVEEELLSREGWKVNTQGEMYQDPNESKPFTADVLHPDSTSRAVLREIADNDGFGSRVAAVSNYFLDTATNTTATLRFAARAIKDYGPMAGMAMANAYHRYGGYDVPMREEDGFVVTEFGDVLPPYPEGPAETRNSVLSMLRSRLPTQRTYEAGAEPPSEGFIIDGNGNVLAHAVGRGSDHFLPFNTRHLKQMRKEDRVEFVRSRMVGGPTIEDLRAAMMMGADRLTVVSNSGTYTLDFTKRSHGIKLEHFEVLNRYQEILDEYTQTGGNKKGEKKVGLLDHQGYIRALESISDEFPLHINFDRTIGALPGTWQDYHDFVQPTHRLMDQLRDLFGIAPGGIVDPSSRKAKPIIPGGGRGPEPVQNARTVWSDYQNFLRAGIPAGEDPLIAQISWLNNIKQTMEAQGKTWGGNLKEELDLRVRQRLQRDSQVMQQPASWGQAAAEGRAEASMALEGQPHGTVHTRQVSMPEGQEPATTRDKKLMNYVSGAKQRYPKAMDFVMEKTIYNTQMPRETKSAESALREIEKAIADGWDNETLADFMDAQLDRAFSPR